MRVSVGSSGSERKKLLFLCQSLPFPPDGGLHLRSFNVLRLLAADFDVTSLFFFRRATRPTPEHVRRGIEGLSRFGSVKAFPIKQDERRARFFADHLRSVATRSVYTRHLYRSSEFGAELGRVLEDTRPDLVHVDSLDLSAYLPRVAHLPTIVTHHNVESRLLRRRAEGEASPFPRAYIRHQGRLMELEERYWAGRVALNVVVSEGEAALLRSICPDARTAVVPNGVDTKLFTPRPSAEGRGIVFVGSHSWLPNRDAMEYFARDILPRVRAAVGEVPVTWVGRASGDVRTFFRREHGIHLTGYVDDVRPHVHDAACYVVPLRVGGGTRLKILDAWAMGAPIVSTSIGCEGLEGRDGENILIRDEADSFADAVIEVLNDAELRGSLGSNGRKTAIDTYDWSVIGAHMMPLYRSLVDQD